MRLLVTGASGFIGRNLIRALPDDWDVTATFCNSDSFPGFVHSLGRPRTHVLRIDLATQSAGSLLAGAADVFDACVFLAANGDPARSVAEPAFDLISNTLALIHVAERVRFKRFVYLSSGAVYDGLVGPVSPKVQVAPLLPYAISKLASERYLQHFQRAHSIDDLFIVRFFGAYGPFEPPRKIYNRMIRQFAFAHDPRFAIRGDGRNLIDAMYIDDAIRAILVLLDTSSRGAIFDCASGAPVTLTTLVETAADTFGLKAEITYTGSVPEHIEFYSVDSTMTSEYQFTPRVALKDGLRRFAEFLRNQPGLQT